MIVALGLTAGVVLAARGLALRAEATADMNRGLELLRRSDPAVVRMDELIGGEISAATATDAVEAGSVLVEASAQLEQASKLLAVARDGVSASDRDLVEAALAAARARADLIAKGAPLLAVNAKAAAALGPSGEAWAMMLDAEKAADEAVAQYNLHTDAGAKQSDVLTDRSAGKLKAARALMSRAASAFPEAGLEIYLSYADEELKALAKSKEVNAAWLKGEKTKANELLKEFNRLESAASVLGRKLEAPSSVVSKAYDLLVADLLPAYSEARVAATGADEGLNSLGP